MKILKCTIDKIKQCELNQGTDYKYSVWDGDKKVAEGTSSSFEWVQHDAGGYHTKKDFDKLYPEGWKVEFDFNIK